MPEIDTLASAISGSIAERPAPGTSASARTSTWLYCAPISASTSMTCFFVSKAMQKSLLSSLFHAYADGRGIYTVGIGIVLKSRMASTPSENGRADHAFAVDVQRDGAPFAGRSRKGGRNSAGDLRRLAGARDA